MSHQDLCACGKQAKFNIPVPGEVLQVGRFCLECALASGRFCQEHMIPHALYQDGSSICPHNLNDEARGRLIFRPSILLGV